METFYTDNQTYVASKAQLVDIEQSLAAAPGNSFTVTSPTVNSYTLSGSPRRATRSRSPRRLDGSVIALLQPHRRHHQGRLPGQQQLVSTAPPRRAPVDLGRSWYG